MLGIETSCDETGVAVFDPTGTGEGHGLLAHTLYSQVAMHADYGGVVPELASRDHVRKLTPLIRQTLTEAGLTVRDLRGVAYTAGPGLVGALLVGASAARALAWSRRSMTRSVRAVKLSTMAYRWRTVFCCRARSSAL